jgi:hypothetical protein
MAMLLNACVVLELCGIGSLGSRRPSRLMPGQRG